MEVRERDMWNVIPHRATETVGAHRRSAAGMPAEKRPPGIFHLTKGGGVEQDRTRTRAVPEILHWRPAQIFGQIFLGKNFGK
jgi:hypothetical protein